MLLTGKKVVTTIAEAEPLGPASPMDALLIAPCTGNTLAKLANGITDTAVTMVAKAHLRNGRPVVIALSTNDGLSASAENIAKLLNRKHFYFVPFRQDDPINKPRSLQADFSLLDETLTAAINGKQFQPIIK
jgi:dipicolinate synthase subunit B